jgi:hypothetical protein
MNSFKFLGTVVVLKLPDNLDWDTYTFRQKTHNVHKETKTIPLIWDEKLSDKIIYHQWYPHFKDFLETLNLGSLGYIQSAILIKLPAGKSIPTHIDAAPFFKKYSRIHIAIITNEQCFFTVSDETKNLKVGEIWEIDNDNQKHSVVNGGITDRIHLLIDFYRYPDLIISTHSKFMLNQQVIHRGQGIYYGSFKTPKGYFVVSRNTTDRLLEIENGNVISETVIPSKFVHDCILHQNKVYIADTGNGQVIILNYPNLKVYKIHQVFTIQNHINTLLFDQGILWCLLHNQGKSILVGIDPETGITQKTYKDIGVQSHGLSRWNNGFLILSSAESSLIHLNDSGMIKVLCTIPGYFLKGLTVKNDLCFFGASPPFPRGNRGDPGLMCDLVCFDLINGKVLSKIKLQTCGLLNNII